MAEPLIVLEGICRDYPAGEGLVRVLDGIDLVIEKGEFVAIVGASGSGKSTLMNLLGCLDRPSEGSYRIAGQETGALDVDRLAELRREYFGFIFQRYHLLTHLSALGNVEIPALYAGQPPERRQTRAAGLLSRLGMEDRLNHRPGQLSGGQQQRVSIARALMNDAQVILADEPTGALDRQSGEEVLTILRELHEEGKTVIVVTHDMEVAKRAGRIVEVSDGRILADRLVPGEDEGLGGAAQPRDRSDTAGHAASLRARLDRFGETFRMALLSMLAHRLRSLLTMLGIVIGIASVVCMVALGAGSTERVLANISRLGTNTLEVFPGKDFGDVRAGKVTTLVVADAEELAKQPYVAAATPTVTSSKTVRYAALEANAQVNGVGEQYFDAKGSRLMDGRLFDADSVRRRSQEAVIDENTLKTFFGGSSAAALGQVLLVGSMPARVVGVVATQQGGFGSSQNLSVYLPYTTLQTRLLGSTSLRSITLRIASDTTPALAEQAVDSLLIRRHGSKDFFILNTDDIRQTITSTTETMTLLIAAIAVISLVVGGIGVMNIMLVSVSERTGEIGVRMAVGARQSDILQQFLIEALLVCLIGGVIGIGAAFGVGALFEVLGSSFALVYSTTSIVAAFVSSSLIGIVFGYLPARSASHLDPVAALARE